MNFVVDLSLIPKIYRDKMRHDREVSNTQQDTASISNNKIIYSDINSVIHICHDGSEMDSKNNISFIRYLSEKKYKYIIIDVRNNQNKAKLCTKIWCDYYLSTASENLREMGLTARNCELKKLSSIHLNLPFFAIGDLLSSSFIPASLEN